VRLLFLLRMRLCTSLAFAFTTFSACIAARVVGPSDLLNQPEDSNKVGVPARFYSGNYQGTNEVVHFEKRCGGSPCNTIPKTPTVEPCQYDAATCKLVSGSEKHCLKTGYIPTLDKDYKCMPANDLSSVISLKIGECLDICILTNSCPKTYPCTYSGGLGSLLDLSILSCSSIHILS